MLLCPYLSAIYGVNIKYYENLDICRKSPLKCPRKIGFELKMSYVCNIIGHMEYKNIHMSNYILYFIGLRQIVAKFGHL